MEDRTLSRLRWGVLALTFAATTLNYVDRQVIALLKPTLEREFAWRDADYAHIVSGFQLATAATFLFAGWFVDRVGLRRGYALGVGAWSVAAAAHALAHTVGQFFGVRVALGIAETVNTPAAVKTAATWFPERERSLALGIGNTAPNIGAVITPLVVPALAAAAGWRATFLLTGAAGGVWLAAWLALPRARMAEAAREPDALAATRVPIARLAGDRDAWAIAVAKLLTDAVWWFMLFWSPDLFHRRFGLEGTALAGPLAAVYLMAACGALFGGWLPTRLLARGWGLDRARRAPLALAAVVALPLPLLLLAPSLPLAVALVGLTLAAHQCFSTNVFAFATDRFPSTLVASVIGFGALFGNLSGLAMNELAGFTLTRTGGYAPLLFLCAGAYTAAFIALRAIGRPRVGGI